MLAWCLQAHVDVGVVSVCRRMLMLAWCLHSDAGGCWRGVCRQMLMFAWCLQVDVDVRVVPAGGC